ncbi:MAG: class I SAM-dependent methyltransferase [Lachnospiraceae bacterium]
MEHLTAKISCFARAYHYKNNTTHIFGDSVAELLLGKEYKQIEENMKKGIGFFFPDFEGTQEEGLRCIVDQQLSPSVLGRSAFCENALAKEREKGCGQYVLFAAGYDTYALRNRDMSFHVYELDLPELIADKNEKIQASGLESDSILVPCNLAKNTWDEKLLQAGFMPAIKTFGSLLGISYYLSEEEFQMLLQKIRTILSEDSVICFDFPTKESGKGAAINRQLATGAGEPMKARYSFAEMEKLLSVCGYDVSLCLNHKEATMQYFASYNEYSTHHMEAPEGVGYILARRKCSTEQR